MGGSCSRVRRRLAGVFEERSQRQRQRHSTQGSSNSTASGGWGALVSPKTKEQQDAAERLMYGVRNGLHYAPQAVPKLMDTCADVLCTASDTLSITHVDAIPPDMVQVYHPSSGSPVAAIFLVARPHLALFRWPLPLSIEDPG